MRCDNCTNEISVWQTGYKVGNMTICSECNKTNHDQLKRKEKEKFRKSDVINKDDTEEWFYGKENEQMGPISKPELSNLIKQNAVKGDDLVWTQGMKNWKKSKEVHALEVGIDDNKMPNMKENTSNVEGETFFSAEGRLRRSSYFFRVILLSLPGAFFSIVSESSGESGLVGLLALLVIVCGILAFVQAIKRLHDINLNGAYCLAFFIPIINFILGMYILFTDGTAGPNEYGKDPKGRAAENLIES